MLLYDAPNPIRVFEGSGAPNISLRAISFSWSISSIFPGCPYCDLTFSGCLGPRWLHVFAVFHGVLLMVIHQFCKLFFFCIFSLGINNTWNGDVEMLLCISSKTEWYISNLQFRLTVFICHCVTRHCHTHTPRAKWSDSVLLDTIIASCTV